MSDSRPFARPRPPIPTSCAGMWAQAEEPAWGSAAPATFWVALEQNGPWGNKALTQSRLDPALGAALERACAQAGGRALLIRAPGVHPEHDGTRRLYVSGGTGAGAPWLLSADIDDPADVLSLPFDTLAGADPEPARTALPGLRPDSSVLLVCTNAKRDTCCAMLGRPLAIDAEARRPGRVWECTHTGGHRFSPTGIALPTGATLARLSPELALAAVDAAERRHLAPDTLDTRHFRGLSHLPPAAQAADGFVRAETGETDPTAWRTTVLRAAVDPTGDHLVEVVRRSDGDRRLLTVRKRYDDTRQRKNSCATGPVAAESWVVTPADDRTWANPH